MKHASNFQEFQEPLIQPMYENVTTELYLNIDSDDETEADVKKIKEFVENDHQRKKKLVGKRKNMELPSTSWEQT
jgi:hypothetical protein